MRTSEEWVEDGHRVYLVIDDGEIVDRDVVHPEKCMKEWHNEDDPTWPTYRYADCVLAYMDEGVGVASTEDLGPYGCDVLDLIADLGGDHIIDEPIKYHFHSWRSPYDEEYDEEFYWEPV